MDKLRRELLWGGVVLAGIAALCLFAANMRPVHFDGSYVLARPHADAVPSSADTLPSADADWPGADLPLSAEARRSDGTRVNVNTADRYELCAVSGIGPALADRIIMEREVNGRFAYLEDLLNVNGIGRKTLVKLLNQIVLD